MTVQSEQQSILNSIDFKIEHNDEKFFLATTLVTVIVIVFVFNLVY